MNEQVYLYGLLENNCCRGNPLLWQLNPGPQIDNRHYSSSSICSKLEYAKNIANSKLISMDQRVQTLFLRSNPDFRPLG